MGRKWIAGFVWFERSTSFILPLLLACDRKEGKLPRVMEFQFFVRLMQLLGCHLPWQSTSSLTVGDESGEEEGEEDKEDGLGSGWEEAIEKLGTVSQTLCHGSGSCGVSEVETLESILGCVKELLGYNVYQVIEFWLLTAHGINVCICICH